MNCWTNCLHLLVCYEGRKWVTDGDDFVPPTNESIKSAKKVCYTLSVIGSTPPCHLTANGEGGICFEWRSPTRYYTLYQIEIDKDGKSEFWTIP